jgi:hypothetical protein
MSTYTLLVKPFSEALWKMTYSVCGKSSAWNVKYCTAAAFLGKDISETPTKSMDIVGLIYPRIARTAAILIKL